jgi:hypothetical protein
MQFGVDGKSISIDLHCSDDKVHKLRDTALEWVNKNGEKTRQVVEKDESEKIGEWSKGARHLFDNFEDVYSHKRDNFMDFLKGQKEKQEPFEQHVLDFSHEIHDLFKK